MSAKWNLFVDIAQCNGCRNCFLAVKDEYVGNTEPGYFAPQPQARSAWFTVEHVEQGQAPFTEVSYLPKACQHCDDAPCMAAARDGAVTKRPDGIVIIDPVKARGQSQIVAACPYGAISWNGDLQLPQAWPFEAHLLDRGWRRTRVDQVCATGALKSALLEDSDRQKKIAAEGWQELQPELSTKPRVFYRGLDRIRTRFVAGSVEIEGKSGREPLVGAVVEVHRDGTKLATVQSDDFGDFKIAGLKPGSAVVIRILNAGQVVSEIVLTLDHSTSLGRILAN